LAVFFLPVRQARGVSLPAGRQGEIFVRICLFNDGLLSNNLWEFRKKRSCPYKHGDELIIIVWRVVKNSLNVTN
jgi:hypothetical protein